METSRIESIFEDNKCKVPEWARVEELVGAVRDFEENTGKTATDEDVLNMMLDEEAQWGGC